MVKDGYFATLSQDPAAAGVWNDLGMRLVGQGRIGAAIVAFERSLRLDPDSPETWNNLGVAHQFKGRFATAEECFRRAFARSPENAAILMNLGSILREKGWPGEAIAACKAATALAPDFAQAEMNLVNTLPYRPGVGLSEILTHARRWSRAAAIPAAQPERPAGKPRIGLISADFRQHAVGCLTLPAIEGLARLGHGLTLYSNSAREDSLTLRFRAAATQWRNVVDMDDDALAAQIRADGIGILIDLSGFSAGNRMTVLARKPAPVQIGSWVGYPTTTGSPAMDYILADRHQVPEGAERFYSERVIRLPDSYVSFEPPSDAPEPGESPCREREYVTFGSFNALKKINSRVISVWSRLMRSVPDSRLVMKALGLECAATRQRFAAIFAANGINPDRLIMAGNTPIAEHFDWMRRTDLALDPFPYSGGRTTLEALWMGLPVVTLPSESFAGRHSLGYLTTLGLTNWIARDEEHYGALIAALAQDPNGLADWRRSLRGRMLASPLADSERFARDLDRTLMAVWTQ